VYRCPLPIHAPSAQTHPFAVTPLYFAATPRSFRYVTSNTDFADSPVQRRNKINAMPHATPAPRISIRGGALRAAAQMARARPRAPTGSGAQRRRCDARTITRRAYY